MYVIGGFGDQLISLVWEASNNLFLNNDLGFLTHLPYQVLFKEYLDPFSSNQPVLWGGLSLLLRAGSNSYNAFIVISILLIYIITWWSLKKHKYANVFALIFTFSTYTWLHIGVHPSLMQIWLIPLGFYLFYNYKNLKYRILKLVVFLVLSSFVSSYLTLIILMAFITHAFTDVLISIGKTPGSSPGVRVLLSPIGGKTLGFSPKSFIAKIGLSKLKNYKSHIEFVLVTVLASLGVYIWYKIFLSELTVVPQRAYNDFFVFSSRPWYSFIPPIKHPVLGGIGSNIVNWLNSTGYFLADDYFYAEHGAAYFGLLFILIFFFFVGFAYHKDKKFFFSNVLSPLLTSFLIMSLTLPPFFTIGGLKIYTPGELIYRFLPFFRATTRIYVVILYLWLYLLILIFNKLMSSKLSNNKYKLLVFAFVGVTVFETYIPLEMTVIQPPDPVYAYMQQSTPVASTFFVYPYGATYEALFRLPVHQRLLMNPRYFTPDPSKSPEEYTVSIASDNGISSLIERDVNYLLVSKMHIDGKNYDDLVLFEQSANLQAVYSNDSYTLYEVLPITQ